MTAFLIESYTALQEDPSDVMVRLLDRIANQTERYALVNGSLISTAVSVAPPAFSPPTSAVHVNILWFASLLFSLITASFGMLVKQWLREFLAGDYVSPQARLRIRHFRYPGLQVWKVFAIAAFLPLLLQLSLGLFFLGLCIFTWSVHPSIGKTTTPLVAGWAFFFFAATFSPVFSARCPYKTTLLREPLNYIRRQVARRLRLLASHAAEQFHSSLSPVEEWELSQVDFSKRISPSRKSRHQSVEEEDVATDESRDVEILLAVDEALTDDELVTSTMWESLLQTQTPLPVMVQFMRGVLTHRLRNGLKDLTIPVFPHFLSRGQWHMMVYCLTDALDCHLTSSLRKCIPLWLNALNRREPSTAIQESFSAWSSALILVLSPSPYPFTLEAGTKLAEWLSDSTLCHLVTHILWSEHLRGLGRRDLFRTLNSLAAQLNMDGHSTFTALNHLALWYVQDHSVEPIPFPQDATSVIRTLITYKDHLKTAFYPGDQEEIVLCLIHVLSELTGPAGNDRETSTLATTSASAWSEVALTSLFTVLEERTFFPPELASRSLNTDLAQLCTGLVCNSNTVSTFIICFMRWNISDVRRMESIMRLVFQSLREPSRLESKRSQYNFTHRIYVVL
jgi:hypothetical protein